MRALDFGRRVRGVRQKLGLTQAQFAQRIGVTKVSIARYEAGRIPRFRLLTDIARIGGVTVTWLLEGSNPQAPQRQQQQVVFLESRLAELARDFLNFLQRKTPAVTKLPTQHRRRYEDRIREVVKRAIRELEEYERVLEAESRRRRRKL